MVILHIAQILPQAGGVHHGFYESAKKKSTLDPTWCKHRGAFSIGCEETTRMDNDGQMGKKVLVLPESCCLYGSCLNLSQPVGGGDEESDDAESETKAFYAL